MKSFFDFIGRTETEMCSRLTRNGETGDSAGRSKKRFFVRVSSFCVSGQSATHFGFGPPNEVKERLHRLALRRTGRPSADVAAGRGGLSRPTLVGADQGACAFLLGMV
ncbi:MAG: hypothetical protein WB217_11085 [Mesobacillus sp.]|uniref:hypothetical protein n=1 Tax=Mesobacillus sp. TaxID=2675271 RepID=UPI003C417599